MFIKSKWSDIILSIKSLMLVALEFYEKPEN